MIKEYIVEIKRNGLVIQSTKIRVPTAKVKKERIAEICDLQLRPFTLEVFECIRKENFE